MKRTSISSGSFVLLFMLGCGGLLDPEAPEGLALGEQASELGTLDIFVPIHLIADDVLLDAPDLVINTSNTIDTTSLTIGGVSNGFFVVRGSYAVLFTGTFTLQPSLVAFLKIQGTRPLIISASGNVTLNAGITLAGAITVAGPGALATGSGVGGPGVSFLPPGDRQSSGGGGGSYGTAGAAGGGRIPNTPPGTGGITYGPSITDPLVGGSRGGHGGWSLGGTGSGAGGGGGGALQISSATNITLSANISAGGGGGRGGGNGFYGGGGGGSGGAIIFEAPTLSLSGVLMANGGGGGGGGGGAGGSNPSTMGADGFNGGSVTAPPGGNAGIPQGSKGGSGSGIVSGIFTNATAGLNTNSKGGGGGGGAGRIWLRYRAATPPSLGSVTIVPAPGHDPSMP